MSAWLCDSLVELHVQRTLGDAPVGMHASSTTHRSHAATARHPEISRYSADSILQFAH